MNPKLIADKQLISICPLSRYYRSTPKFLVFGERMDTSVSNEDGKGLYASHPGKGVKNYMTSWGPLNLKALCFDLKPIYGVKVSIMIQCNPHQNPNAIF